ncbi:MULTISPECIES: hypothetical protein [Haloarculaceae]|jgi:hypothetical protein|uniref:Uncharacterized protein n=2 Tax=Haloarculaceae TaxID=1963268 RepID=A0A4D6H839_9EURY|nr:MULTISPECIES: hypothetical protein [Haloarculaceae]QCC49910.1 hypothetical protein DV733_01125 [Halapricum salinum]
MHSDHVGSDWTVEWATPTPGGDGYLDNLVLSRNQARAYGDELVMSLRVDEEMLQERGIDPTEPFAWKIEDSELLTKQISRQAFETVAESDRDDAGYASEVLDYRARRRISDTR